MGGSAFASSGLKTARLSANEYSRLSNRVLSLLEPLFARVQCPRAAPEKLSHGDVDVFALHSVGVETATIAQRLGAVKWIDGSPTSNFALPVATLVDDAEAAAHEADGVVYQVDVHVCETAEEWEMGMLMHEFGDLGMILSKMATTSCPDVVLSTYGLRVRRRSSPPPFQASR